MNSILSIIALTSLLCGSFAEECGTSSDCSYGKKCQCKTSISLGHNKEQSTQCNCVVACEELEVDCHGECCTDAALAAETHLRCPGWVDPDTKCKVGADWCLETLYDNTWEYANSTGAAKQCPNYCPSECSWPEEMYCYEKNWDGCGKSVCVKADPLAMCPQNCPLSCSEFDIQCEGHYYNHTNSEMTLECYTGDYCIPMAYNYDGEIECPGVCYTHCDWEAGENYCPIYTTDGCFAGNTCEKPGTTGFACGATTTGTVSTGTVSTGTVKQKTVKTVKGRFVAGDVALRSGSPLDVYNKLKDNARHFK